MRAVHSLLTMLFHVSLSLVITAASGYVIGETDVHYLFLYGYFWCFCSVSIMIVYQDMVAPILEDRLKEKLMKS